MVVKLGGEIAANARGPRARSPRTSRCSSTSGIRIVLVHGGGPQATEMQKRLGLEPIMVGGRRVTDEATLDVAKMVFAGKINTDILSALRGAGRVGRGPLRRGRRHPARDAAPAHRGRRPGHRRDAGRRLRPRGRHPGRGHRAPPLLLENKYVPVLASLASDGDGQHPQHQRRHRRERDREGPPGEQARHPHGRAGPAPRPQRPLVARLPHHHRGGEGGDDATAPSPAACSRSSRPSWTRWRAASAAATSSRAPSPARSCSSSSRARAAAR